VLTEIRNRSEYNDGLFLNTYLQGAVLAFKNELFFDYGLFIGDIANVMMGGNLSHKLAFYAF